MKKIKLKHGDISRIAKKTKVSPAEISRVMADKRRSSPDLAIKLTKIFNTTLEFWFKKGVKGER